MEHNNADVERELDRQLEDSIIQFKTNHAAVRKLIDERMAELEIEIELSKARWIKAWEIYNVRVLRRSLEIMPDAEDVFDFFDVMPFLPEQREPNDMSCVPAVQVGISDVLAAIKSRHDNFYLTLEESELVASIIPHLIGQESIPGDLTEELQEVDSRTASLYETYGQKT